MSCFFPIDAWKSRTVNESGKRSIVFRRLDGYDDTHLQVPCGKCDGCRADRSREWAIRIFHEASLHEKNCFVTFTYRPESIPVNADGVPTLDKSALSSFFVKARRIYRLRYFAVGEYGEATRRPHYHAIIFGQDFLEGSYQINDQLYSHPVIEKLWPHGMVSIGGMSMSSACYVAGYVFKKIGDEDTFAIMSRRPGIGHAWLDRYYDDLADSGVVSIDGKELPVPKRYMQWREQDFQLLKEQRKAMFDHLSIDEVIKRREALPHRQANMASKLSNRKSKF